MIIEDFVSFEVAKLLKEKGFNEPCYRYYDNKGDVCGKYINPDIPFNYSSAPYYLCPSQSMTMKWIREIYDIFIVIRRGLTGTGWVYSHEIYKDSQCLYARYGASYDTYEEAVEAALKYALENLI